MYRHSNAEIKQGEIIMKYTEFVFKFKKYKDDEKKVAELVQSVIKTHYIPWVRKNTIATEIARKGLYNTDGKFAPDTAKVYFLYVVAILKNYTNLEWSDGEDEAVFDALDEVGAVESIIGEVGKDAGVFQTVLDMHVDDTTDSERNLVDFFGFKIDELLQSAVNVFQTEILNKMGDGENASRPQ